MDRRDECGWRQTNIVNLSVHRIDPNLSIPIISPSIDPAFWLGIRSKCREEISYLSVSKPKGGTFSTARRTYNPAWQHKQALLFLPSRTMDRGMLQTFNEMLWALECYGSPSRTANI